MSRHLWVKAGLITNVVEYSTAPPNVDGDNDVVPAVTGLESVGDAFDVTDALKERILNSIEQAIFQELFRLTNAVRVIQGQATISAATYRTFIKTLV